MNQKKPIKLVTIYQVILPYRVGVYERLASNPNIDFELLYGKSSKGTKKINYKGEKKFKCTRLRCFYIPFKTNVGSSTLQIAPFLFFSLMKRKPDVVFTEGISNLVNATTAFLYTKLFRKKIVWWSLGDVKGRKHTGIRKFMQKWIDYVEKHADAIFTYSTQGENFFLAKGIPPEKIFKGINVNDTEKKLAEIRKIGKTEKEAGFHIVFVGAVTQVKKLETLLQAYRHIKTKYPDMYLHIIGEGDYLPTIKEYAAQLRVADIQFHGKVTEGLSELLLRFHVLVLPGLGGLAIVDGMLHALPVITGKADGTEIDLIDSSCGFVKEELDTGFLTEKLEYLYLHPEQAEKMGQQGFRRITEKFPIKNYMQALYEAIDYAIKPEK